MLQYFAQLIRNLAQTYIHVGEFVHPWALTGVTNIIQFQCTRHMEGLEIFFITFFMFWEGIMSTVKIMKVSAFIAIHVCLNHKNKLVHHWYMYTYTSDGLTYIYVNL